MKLALCGSIAFYEKMKLVQKELQDLGHDVVVPPSAHQKANGEMVDQQEFYTTRHTAGANEAWVWDVKNRAMLGYFQKVAWSDAIVVLNYDKNNISGYVGANTLMEMGLALYLHKPIYLLKSVPQMSYTEEILGMKPTVVSEDLTKI